MSQESPPGKAGKITIPETIGEMKSALTGIDRLLMAREWERAAIVAAFVKPQQGKRIEPTSSESRGSYTISQFATLGIRGLTHHETISFYVNAWKGTGLPQPRPGETVALPNLPWPPQDSIREVVKRNTKAVAEAMADPAFVEKVVDRMEPDAKTEVSRKVTESRAEDLAVKHGGRTPIEGEDYNKPGDPALNAAVDQIERKGEIAEKAFRLKVLIEDYGPIPPDDSLAKTLFELTMTINMAIASVEGEVRQ